jgi:gas vesicle protein
MKLKEMVNAAKKVADSVVKNGKEFYQETSNDVKNIIRSDKEKINLIEDVVNDKTLTEDQKAAKIKEIIGLKKKTSTERSLDLCDLADRVFLLTSDNELSKKILAVSERVDEENKKVLSELDKDTRDLIRKISDIRTTITNKL